MTRLPRALIARHFINGQQSLETCIEGISLLCAAKEFPAAKDADFEFGLKLTVDHRLSDSAGGNAVLREARSLYHRLPPDFWYLYDPKDRGSGTSYKQVVFNPTFSSGLVVLADLDAFTPRSDDAFQRIADLTDKVEKNNALFGMGARDQPIALARHPSNSTLRCIHELYHSLAIALLTGPRSLLVDGNASSEVTPAYAAFGESTTGLWVMNRSHSRSSDFEADVRQATQQPGMNGFATEYYASIRGPFFGPRVSGYVVTQQNRFYHEKSESDERNDVCRLIRNSTAVLGRTKARYSLALILGDPRAVRKLNRFYRRKDINRVQELMHAGLTQGPLPD